MMKSRQPESILFDEIYLVGVLLLTWFLFRLAVIVFVFQFWNVCVPSALLSTDLEHVGLFWFVVAMDVFALAWLTAYVARSVRQRKHALGRSVFAGVTLLFIAGNLMLLPVLFEWRKVEHDSDSSHDVLQAFAKTFGLPVRSRPYVPQFESCSKPQGVEFGQSVLEARDDWRADFWRYYGMRTSRHMEIALDLVEARLGDTREDDEAWAMKALVYGNSVDFMAMSPGEARVGADAALEQALEHGPQSNVTHAAYGLLMRSRDTEGAEARLKQCVADVLGFAECHNLLGDLLRKTGRAEQAGEIYLQGLERWPDNGELHVSYALHLQETDQASAAIEYLRTFVARQPNFPRGHWHLAVMLYEEGGDLDEARRHAVKALEMDPRIWNGEKLLLELSRLEAGKAD